MVSVSLPLFILSCLAAVATANPVPSTTPNPSLFCEVVDLAVTVLNAQSTASHFCSAYLSVPTKTVTITPTSTLVLTTSKTTTTGTTTVVEPASTSLTTTTIIPTITGTNTFTTYITTGTSTSTSTSTVTLTGSTIYTTGYPTVCTSLRVYARDDLDVLAPRSSIAKPACFSAYTSGALLSSACSCLSLATPTLTATASHGITVTSISSGFGDVLASTTTVPVTTATVTTTLSPVYTMIDITVTSNTFATASTTITTTTPVASPAFFLQAGTADKDYNNNYAQIAEDSLFELKTIMFDLPSITDASVFSLDADCHLVAVMGAVPTGYVAAIISYEDTILYDGMDVAPVTFIEPGTTDAYTTYVTCQYIPAGVGGSLVCVDTTNGAGPEPFQFINGASDTYTDRQDGGVLFLGQDTGYNYDNVGSAIELRVTP